MEKLLLYSKKNLGKIILGLCEILLGVQFLIDPVKFTSIIIMAIGIALILLGVVYVIRYFRTDPISAHLEQGLAKALCALAFGVFCLIRSDWFISAFPIVTILYGLIILFTGFIRVQWAVDMLRMKTGRWYLIGIGAALSIAFGVIIVLNPFAWTEFLWTFVAISLIVDAIFDICAVFLIRPMD